VLQTSGVQRAIRVAAIVVGLSACTKGESGTAPAEARSSDAPPANEPDPMPKAAMLGKLVAVRIVERHKTEDGIEARVSIDGRRAALFAGLDTPLAAATDANEHLELELAPEPGSEADRPDGALELAGVTHRILAFDAWLLPADTISHGALVGVWRVPKAGREEWNPVAKTVRQPGIPQFAYDGKYVVVRLFTEKDWMWKSKDDRYKLETRWVSGEGGRDELQYKPPFGGWTVLAASVHEGKARRLMLAESDKNWPLERVRKAADGDEDDNALVVDRAPHDYSTKPMDPP
jgi:hypothetical protein